MEVKRPAIVKDDHLIYLDHLRECRFVDPDRTWFNLAAVYSLKVEDAQCIHRYWRDSFSERQGVE